MYSKQESLLGMLKPMMMFTGTWRLDGMNSTVRWFYWLYSLIFHGFGVLFIISVVAKFVEFVKSGADSEDIISSQVFLLSGTCIFSKFLIYQICNVSDILKAILQEEEKIWLSKDSESISAYQADIKHVRKWNWGILLSTMFTGVALMSAGVASLIQADISSINSEGNEKEEWSMIPMWLPYNEREHRSTVVVLKCIFTFIYVCMFIVSGMTFVALMIYSLGLLKMEQVKIGKCNWTSYNMADLSVDMKTLLINNRRVFRFIKHLDRSIRYVVLVDVLLNSISIAALATNITNVQRGDFVFCTGFLLMQVTQVFVLGWFANDIIMLSRTRADVLYNLNWYYLDLKNRKLFGMMLMQCQQLSVISIGPFGPMTIGSVISVIKAAYSYMMLMQSYK
uniref:Odorant receptor n=1 Tax=Dendroctonus ponderosae TaxID=77166 RepID=R9PSN2_DENPD